MKKSYSDIKYYKLIGEMHPNSVPVTIYNDIKKAKKNVARLQYNTSIETGLTRNTKSKKKIYYEKKDDKLITHILFYKRTKYFDDKKSNDKKSNDKKRPRKYVKVRIIGKPEKGDISDISSEIIYDGIWTKSIPQATTVKIPLDKFQEIITLLKNTKGIEELIYFEKDLKNNDNFFKLRN